MLKYAPNSFYSVKSVDLTLYMVWFPFDFASFGGVYPERGRGAQDRQDMAQGKPFSKLRTSSVEAKASPIHFLPKKRGNSRSMISVALALLV